MFSIKKVLFVLVFLNATVLLLYYRFLNNGLSTYKVSKNHEIENSLIQEKLPLDENLGVSAALLTTSFVQTMPSDEVLDSELVRKKFEELESLEEKEKFITHNKERLEEIRKALDLWQQMLKVQKAQQEVKTGQDSGVHEDSNRDQDKLFVKNVQDTVWEKSDKLEEVEDDTTEKIILKNNLLEVLDAYQKVDGKYFDRTPQSKPDYRTKLYSLHHENSYCKNVDVHHLENPEELFNNQNFFTDYQLQSLPRQKVAEFGNDMMPEIYYEMPIMRRRNYRLDMHINNFFLQNDGFHEYHKIGKHFLCITQMYNHIPGNGGLIRKDKVLDMVKLYEQKYIDQSQCFNKDMFILPFFRLYDEEECKYFFTLINSEEYRQPPEENRTLYLIKDANDLPEMRKSILLNDLETVLLNEQFQNGLGCGTINQSLIAQQYISNPLLLYTKSKFKIRAYMLVASTNPLIVYYHDGYLNATITSPEAEEHKFLEYSDLSKFLQKSMKVTDKNWLDSYLRPQLKKAFAHLARMASIGFWNQSNVYELFGVDFIMDEDLRLWFLGADASPVLTGINDKMIGQMVLDLFDIQFAYYRSRMLRVVEVLYGMQEEEEENELQEEDITQWKEEYQTAVKNRLEPDFEISKNNTFVLIVDESKEKEEAYFSNIPIECVV